MICLGFVFTLVSVYPSRRDILSSVRCLAEGSTSIRVCWSLLVFTRSCEQVIVVSPPQGEKVRCAEISQPGPGVPVAFARLPGGAVVLWVPGVGFFHRHVEL
jgi:hypothetical protein